MNKKHFFFLILFFVFGLSNLLAQSIMFPDDSKQRGYYDRPYKKYEAEEGKCKSDGTFLTASYDQRTVQSEASNAMALQLIKKDSYVEWTNDETANGLVIRFSLPDGKDGLGTKGVVALYVDGKFVFNITLDSFWAWAWLDIPTKGYPGNDPGENKFARMRFDDTKVLLKNKINKGSKFKLIKVDDNEVPYTIDFVELEPVPVMVTFKSIKDPNKVMYNPSEGTLNKFVANHSGKTIYIPEGKFDVSERIVIAAPNTKLIGAGMWYTEIFFSASTDDPTTFNKRGISSSHSNTVIDGFYVTTANRARYYLNVDSKGVGKALMGSFGSNSVIKNVWAMHFECGGWLTGTDHMTVQHCRFRNNYADGINLASGSKYSVVEHCSFRNNGDDDMASWSNGNRLCEEITYRYNTSENNWRASAIGFFGGRGHKALNCVVIDPMEAALRATSDFPGQGFSTDGFILFENISVYRGGVKAGDVGTYGNIIRGDEAGAIHITSYRTYDTNNIKFSNIDLYDSKSDAIYFDSRNGKVIRNVYLENININGTSGFGASFHKAQGQLYYNNWTFNNIGSNMIGEVTPGFEFLPFKK